MAYHQDQIGRLIIDVEPAIRIRGPPPDAYRNQSVPRGCFFIANWKTFDGDIHPERHGSERDVENVKTLFIQSGYICVGEINDCTKQELLDALKALKENPILKDVDSFVGIFMTHGDESLLYTRNGEGIKVKEIYRVFNNQEFDSLAGKPKVFLLQHCRGVTRTAVDESGYHVDGRSFVEEHRSASLGLGRVSDTYLCYSTLEGNVSYRHDRNGSIFIEHWCRVFCKKAKDTEIYRMIPNINKNLKVTPTRQICDFQGIGYQHDFYFNPRRISDHKSSSSLGETQHLILTHIEGATSNMAMNAQASTSQDTSGSSSSSVSNTLSESTGSQKHYSPNPSDVSLAEEIYGLTSYPRGSVYILNNIKGCDGDVDKLALKFKELGYEIIHKSRIHSYQLLKENIQEININPSATLVVFFFGYGYGDNIFMGSNDRESVSYRKFCETFKEKEDEGCALIMFTNICFKEGNVDTVNYRKIKKPVLDTFHLCVKVDGDCQNGSLMTKALLREFEDSGSKEEFGRLAGSIARKIEEWQKDNEDTYFTDFRCYGIYKFFHFSSPLQEEGELCGSQEKPLMLPVASPSISYAKDSEISDMEVPLEWQTMMTHLKPQDLTSEGITRQKYYVGFTKIHQSTMAGQQPHPITYKPEDIYLFRLRKINGDVSTRVMHVVFLEGISGKTENVSLFDYYDSKGVPVKKFKKNLDKKQIHTIENDPKGKTFDVTLLYKCIQWGSDKVAPVHDDQWKVGNGSLESVLTAVKNVRNDLTHGEPSSNKQQFLDKTMELRTLLTETLRLAETRFGIAKATVDQIIDEMSNNINLYRDKPLVPQDFDDYKKQIFFPEQGNYVRLEGKKLLCQLYDGWVFITPVSLMLKFHFKVNMIYTEMVLIDESTQEKKMKQKYEDLLESINCDITDPVILVEGIAGVGKTTLTKKILNDWASGQTTMSNLTRYDLLLYAECRNSSNKSFKELIINLMPEIAKCFQEQDFSHVVLDQNIILIIDGLDELNKSSTNLFIEVLELKKTHGLTIIATTRPEYVMSYYHLVDSFQIRTKHIKLIGIAQKKRKEFVSKYHDEMKKKNLSTQNIGRLLEYLKETELRLSDLWMLPYNLTLLVILWVDDPLSVYGITTAPELYWKIHQMILRKLIGRLSLNEFTNHIPKSFLKKKIEDFISSLCREALLGLKNDEINLPEEAHQRLEDSCVQEGIPSEEMTGAFLKMVVMRTSLGIDTKYSFPHKGLQEFFGALKFFKEILKRIQRCNLRQVKDCPNKDYHDTSASTSTGVPLQKTNVIREILEDLHGTSTFNIEKYQNLFITLIGMFYIESNNIGNDIKLEALELLKETGIKGSDWIGILNSVKCNSFVASFINKQPDVLVKYIYINDANLFSYISLLKTLEDPLKDNEVSISIAFKEDTKLFDELMALIKKYQLKVYSITITGKNFSRYTSVLKSLLPLNIIIHIEEKIPDITELINQINQSKLEVDDISFLHEFMHQTANFPWEDAFNQVFQRCNVVGYTGPVTPGMVLQKTTEFDVNVASAHCYGPLRSSDLKRTLSKLEVSVANAKCYTALDRFFQSKPQLHFLGVCLSLDIDPSILNPLPSAMMELNLYLPDISTEEDISNATQIVKHLHPVDGKNMSFHNVKFPRISLGGDGMKSLIRGLNGVKVEISLKFPFASKPSSHEEEQQIQDLAMSELKWTSPQFRLGVEWGEHTAAQSIDDW